MGILVPLHSDLVKILVIPSASSIVAPTTEQLEAYGFYGDGSRRDLTRTVTWASSDPTKATVSSVGLVTGVSAGSTNVTATLGSVVGTCAVTVS